MTADDRPTLGDIRGAIEAARAKAAKAGLEPAQADEWACVCDAMARWSTGVNPYQARARARGLANYRRLEAARGAPEPATLIAIAEALEAAARPFPVLHSDPKGLR